MDCPLDLSALLIFSPIPAYSDRRLEEALGCSCHVCLVTDCAAHKKQKVENSVDASSLIYGVPWYKTVCNLHLWDVSFIDAVLISSPMGMLGLPFLTRNKNFSAKVNVQVFLQIVTPVLLFSSCLRFFSSVVSGHGVLFIDMVSVIWV